MHPERRRSSFAFVLAYAFHSSGCYAIYTLPIDAAPSYANGGTVTTNEGRRVRLADAIWLQPEGHEEARVQPPLKIEAGPFMVVLRDRERTVTLDPRGVRALEVKQETSGAGAGRAVSIGLGVTTGVGLLIGAIVALGSSLSSYHSSNPQFW